MALRTRFLAFYRSFRFRLFLQFTLLTALLIISFAVFFINHEITAFYERQQGECRLLAEQLAINARLPLFAEDKRALMELLVRTLENHHVAEASITNQAGVVLAALEPTDTDMRNIVRESISVQSEGGALTPEAALLGPTGSGPSSKIGTVYLALHTSAVQGRIQQMVAVTLGIGLVFWLLASSLGYLVLKRITRSFNLLMKGVETIEAGDLNSRIPVQSSDEPGRAAQAMNQLAASLQRRDEENRRLQEERDNALRLEVQEEKKRIMARLIQANKMTSLGLLVSSMAHEINNPNSTIGLSVHYLASTWQDARPLLQGLTEEEGDFSLGGIPFSTAQHEITDCIAKIGSNSERISQVVQNLRNYSIGMKGDMVPGVDVNQVIASSLTMVRCYCRQSEATLQLEPGETLPTITGNRQQLEQVVVNLMMNAVQSLPEGRGTVVVATSAVPASGEVLITVTDNGVGLAPEIKERLCEPFTSTRIDEGGSGLGLYISNFILNEHKGSLEFRSTFGAGTKAIIRLPVDSAAGYEPRASS